MELIKQIKDAENRAKELIEAAHKYAAESIENARRQHSLQLEQALQERKKAIEQARTQGEKDGKAEAEELNKHLIALKNELAEKVQKRQHEAIHLIIDFIKKQD